MTKPEPASTLKGFSLATLAFFAWGVFPIYWKETGFCPPEELVFWRLVFTAVFLAPFAFGKMNIKELLCCLCLGTLISVNWGAFIWAVANGYLLQSSLAYFLAPLFSVFFAAVFLKESFNAVTKTALLLACTATMIKVLGADEPITAALIMAVTFSVYGLVKKMQSVPPFRALFYESLCGGAAVLLYLGALPSLTDYSSEQIGILSMSGPVTIFPLILFAFATKLIRLQSVGFLNYLVPVMHFGLATLLYKEPFTSLDAWCFGLIWVAIAMFIFSSRSRFASNPQAKTEHRESMKLNPGH